MRRLPSGLRCNVRWRSACSEPTQQEVIEDRYPLLLIPGAEVARAVRTIALRDGIEPIELLERVDGSYESRLRDRDPEQVLAI